MAEHGIDHVVITIAKTSRTELRRIVEICEQVPVKTQIIPGLYEILSGEVEVSRLREVEIEDLLGRDQVLLDDQVVRGFLAGRNVMVTGAGGSIGSELARQAARFGVGTLLLVERAEFALFAIDRELREAYPELSIVPLVADVSDESRMRPLFNAFRPHIVVHAAAHKHVPMMESNASEAVRNNILATRLLGELAGEFEAASFIQISTDKAVNPTSVMGASKRVAELVVQDLNPRYPTQFVSVRFGNVLGSAGSVIPIFKEQILKGGPVTVTHPDMTRYFMTIQESAQLVLRGRRHRHRGRDLRARHGSPGEDPGHGQGHDRAVWAEALRGHRHRVHRHAAGREAVRGAGHHGRAPHQDPAPEDLHREDPDLPGSGDLEGAEGLRGVGGVWEGEGAEAVLQ